MSVTVKYFASMRDRMGKGEETVNLDNEVTVEQLWQQVSQDTMPDNTLIAINMEYTDRTSTVKNGDEVAFFPPVTGG